MLTRGGGGGPPREVGGAPHLKSGRVNFILPCSVAIFRARGTASSHLERTHSRSHLEAGQQQAIRRGRGWDQGQGAGGRTKARARDRTRGQVQVPHLKRISAFMQALRS